MGVPIIVVKTIIKWRGRADLTVCSPSLLLEVDRRVLGKWAQGDLMYAKWGGVSISEACKRMQ